MADVEQSNDQRRFLARELLPSTVVAQLRKYLVWKNQSKAANGDNRTHLRSAILTCQDSEFALFPSLVAMTLHRPIVVVRVLHQQMVHSAVLQVHV